jgi:hypothetical protein
MKRLVCKPVLTLFVFALYAGSFAPTAKAAAIWLTPWSTDYSNEARGSGNGLFGLGYSFGVGGPHNFAGPGTTVPGPLGNLGAASEALPGTPGHFEEDVSTRIGLLSKTVANETLFFARQFELTGSPAGWTVTLSGNYTAYGLASNAAYFPGATLGFRASVYSTSRPVIGVNRALIPGALGYGASIDTLVTDPNQLGPISAAFTPISGVLPNGTYWVAGSEIVSADIDGSSTPAFVSGTADGLFSADIALNATPIIPPVPPVPPPGPPAALVPEPLSILLLGMGMLSLALKQPKVLGPARFWGRSLGGTQLVYLGEKGEMQD